MYVEIKQKSGSEAVERKCSTRDRGKNTGEKVDTWKNGGEKISEIVSLNLEHLAVIKIAIHNFEYGFRKSHTEKSE